MNRRKLRKWYYELMVNLFPMDVNPKGGGAAIGLKVIGNVLEPRIAYYDRKR
ncbi:MAG: hypothetical protein ACTS68_02005 [Candidatus Hodgkinia cicadicola]